MIINVAVSGLLMLLVSDTLCLYVFASPASLHLAHYTPTISPPSPVALHSSPRLPTLPSPGPPVPRQPPPFALYASKEIPGG